MMQIHGARSDGSFRKAHTDGGGGFAYEEIGRDSRNIATNDFLDLIGKRLGGDPRQYTKFLADLEDALGRGAEINVPHRSNRMFGFKERFASPPGSGDTAWDLYSRLEEWYDFLSERERGDEGMAGGDEKVFGDQIALCQDVLRILSRYGGKSGRQRQRIEPL